MGSTTIHPGFHIGKIPEVREQGDSIGQTQRTQWCMLEEKPRVRQHYEYRWF